MDTNEPQERLLFWTVAGPVALLMTVVGVVAAAAGLALAWLLSRPSPDVRSRTP
jgi:hypothetical protein